jgi:saccharopine dehydrogenase-like NADP-dependent oxidoreductase
MASKTPIKVHGVEVVPLEVLANVVERQLAEKFKDVWPEIKGIGCFRVQVTGKKKGKNAEYVLDLVTEQGAAAVGIPSSIVAQMMLKGDIKKEPGVFGPEAIVDPELFFKELDKRKVAEIHITKKEYIK